MGVRGVILGLVCMWVCIWILALHLLLASVRFRTKTGRTWHIMCVCDDRCMRCVSCVLCLYVCSITSCAVGLEVPVQGGQRKGERTPQACRSFELRPLAHHLMCVVLVLTIATLSALFVVCSDMMIRSRSCFMYISMYVCHPKKKKAVAHVCVREV